MVHDAVTHHLRCCCSHELKLLDRAFVSQQLLL